MQPVLLIIFTDRLVCFERFLLLKFYGKVKHHNAASLANAIRRVALRIINDTEFENPE